MIDLLGPAHATGRCCSRGHPGPRATVRTAAREPPSRPAPGPAPRTARIVAPAAVAQADRDGDHDEEEDEPEHELPAAAFEVFGAVGLLGRPWVVGLGVGCGH